MKALKKPSLAVWKFASCDGCQLTILDCEDELLAVAGLVDIANFPEASREVKPGPYDVSLVEGSITTPHDKARIRKIRACSKLLVSIGACATSGGIQALRNFARVKDYLAAVYASPHFIETLATSTPISDHVKVDFELRGCPVNKYQLIEIIVSFLNGRKPALSEESVCVACKRKGNICTMVARGEPCLGPVTHDGCQALCPSYNRACFGCYGPKNTPNTAPLADWCISRLHLENRQVRDLFRSFNANAAAFKSESLRHENQNH